MYQSIVPHKVIFTKKLSQEKPQRQSERLTRILPLSNNQAILFYDNFWFYHIQLTTINVLYQGKLEGKVFDCIGLNDEKVIMMLIEKRNIVELDLISKKVTEIYKVSTDSLYNSKKQVAQFFLSRLYSFAQSQTFYLQQNLTEQRKTKVIYFPKNKKLTMNLKGFQVRQFEAKNYVYLKLDEETFMVRFRQNPEQNGRFAFEEINLQTNEMREQKIDWPSFVLYSTVIDVKKFHEEKYLICLNSKNSSHEVIVYNKGQKSVQIIYQSEKIIKQCISLNNKLNLGIFSFLYGQTMDSEIISLIDLNTGKLIYSVDAKVDKLVVPKNQEYLIEYSPESKGKFQTCFMVLGLTNKTAHYLKMLENLKVQADYGQEFMTLIAGMLKR